MNFPKKALPILCGVWAIAALLAAAHAGDRNWPALASAARVEGAARAPILAATKAGSRTVAVGDHGVILLSDDNSHFRQAKEVPFRSLLTSVQFVDARHGFAAGHDGVVLGTQDAGETWSLLRAAAGIEQPVLALHFDTASHGLAVGLFGWAMETNDGGRSWTERHIGGETNDHHLLDLFVSPAGTWLIAAEAGLVFRSTDRGETWQKIDTGAGGSLWHGRALADGTLLACGMRGHLMRSTDDGLSWQPVESGTTQSLTSITELPDGTVVVVGMAGVVLRSSDGGAMFSVSYREQGESLTDVLANGTKPLFFSMSGPLP